MKKILSAILLCALLVVSVFALASCGGPNSDPDKAAEALEDNGYEVTHQSGVALEAVAGFLGVDGLEDIVTGMLLEEDEDDEVNGEAVTIYYFEDSDAADEAWETIQELVEESEDEDMDLVIEKSGNMIWAGTKAAIKAAA